MSADRSPRTTGRVRCAAAVACALALARGALAQELEPPAGTPEGADYAIEAADSLGEGDVEVGVGFAGDGGATSRRRHARFRGDSLDAAVRDGAGDALAGGSLEGPVGPGRFGLGRGSPAWGRGLAFGQPRAPWSRSTPGNRRADGDLAWYRVHRGALRAGAMGGRLDAGSRQALELGAGAWSAGLSGGTRGVERASVWWLSPDAARAGAAAGEITLDRAGRWLAEAALARDVASMRLSGWARAGQGAARFGLTKGPRHAVVLQLDPPAASGPRRRRAAADAPLVRSAVTGLAAWWRFAPGAEGARAVLEVQHPLAQHAGVLAGFEEQRGARRDPSVASAAARDLRQGVWSEWRAVEGPLEIAWRHERWGARPWARAVVRAVTGTRVAVRAPQGVTLAVTHTAFRLRRGEHAYLAEREPDRLVLRALAGTGERVRLEIAVPFGGGRIRAAADRTVRAERATVTNWTVDWTRRAKARRPARARETAREHGDATGGSRIPDHDDASTGEEP